MYKKIIGVVVLVLLLAGCGKVEGKEEIAVSPGENRFQPLTKPFIKA